MNPIETLYTALMERLMPVLQTYWPLTLAGCGLLFLLGAIFRWRWICDPLGGNPAGFPAIAYRAFGETGYRIAVGICGVLIILCTLVLWILL